MDFPLLTETVPKWRNVVRGQEGSFDSKGLAWCAVGTLQRAPGRGLGLERGFGSLAGRRIEANFQEHPAPLKAPGGASDGSQAGSMADHGTCSPWNRGISSPSPGIVTASHTGERVSVMVMRASFGLRP